MAWIESHQSLGRHPKLLKLSVELRIHKAQAVGHLKYLWWWALDYARNGDLSAFASAEISAAAEWPGEPDMFHTALKTTGWLEKDDRLHDWDQYAGPWIDTLERQRRYRQNRALRNGDVTVTDNLTKPNQPTKPNLTNHNPPTPQKGFEVPEDLKNWERELTDWLVYKKERGQTYKPRGLVGLWQHFRAIPPELRTAAIGQSIASNWSGIFPPKGDYNAAKIKSGATPITGKYAHLG